MTSAHKLTSDSQGDDADARLLAGDVADLDRLARAEQHNPHSVLGAHPARIGAQDGSVIRAFHPDARRTECLLGDGRTLEMIGIGRGVFAVFVPALSPPVAYRL